MEIKLNREIYGYGFLRFISMDFGGFHGNFKFSPVRASN